MSLFWYLEDYFEKKVCLPIPAISHHSYLWPFWTCFLHQSHSHKNSLLFGMYHSRKTIQVNEKFGTAYTNSQNHLFNYELYSNASKIQSWHVRCKTGTTHLLYLFLLVLHSSSQRLDLGKQHNKQRQMLFYSFVKGILIYEPHSKLGDLLLQRLNKRC